MTGRQPSGPRCVALVGPYLAGKTTLLESLLFATGAIPRKGAAKDGSTVGEASPAARARGMSVEVNVASCSFMDDEWTFLDCPGSIEFSPTVSFSHQNFKREGYGNVETTTRLDIAPTIGYCLSNHY